MMYPQKQEKGIKVASFSYFFNLFALKIKEKN